MQTLKDRPLNCRLKREDFETRRDCEEEILNIQRIKREMVKENAERTALNNILTAINDYYRLAHWARIGSPYDKKNLKEARYRYTEKKIEGFYILTPSGDKIEI